MSPIQHPEKHNKRYLDYARDAARQFGEGFVVWCGSMAVLSTARKESAQEEARRWAAANGRQSVRIQRVKV